MVKETPIRGRSDLSNIVLLIILGDFFEGYFDIYTDGMIFGCYLLCVVFNCDT